MYVAKQVHLSMSLHDTGMRILLVIDFKTFDVRRDIAGMLPKYMLARGPTAQNLL